MSGTHRDSVSHLGPFRSCQQYPENPCHLSSEVASSMPLQVLEVPKVFTMIRVDQLEDNNTEVLLEEVSDKILFTVNNLTPNSFDSKLVEMKEWFKEVYLYWFVNYLVDQSINTELNNHQLYLQLLNGMGCTVLVKFIFCLGIQSYFTTESRSDATSITATLFYTSTLFAFTCLSRFSTYSAWSPTSSSTPRCETTL